MIIQRLDYFHGGAGQAGEMRSITIERPDDLSGAHWQPRFRALAAAVISHAVWDLCRSVPTHRRQALAFLTAQPGSPDWPLLEHWWGYLGLASLRRFQARARDLAAHPTLRATVQVRTRSLAGRKGTAWQAPAPAPTDET